MASQQITEEAVYLCTGNPLPKDIEKIAHWLLNESFANSFRRIQIISKNLHACNCHYIRFYLVWYLTIVYIEISEIKTRKGLALVDIVREVTM